LVDGRPIPAEAIEVDPDARSVFVPFDAETIESAPKMGEISGAFDAAVHEHFGMQP
jgi:hypothetical protein